ncbi:MAG: phosphoenolpyruvate synthase [Gammaproteobacteria bacterium RIFCSPHIGHO2_12_FULL_37_14]|nr:MAG: phosphoenolpyruvate synthase [Gammaproteobacteria bacterium RIFCSPHIGHO2_12_FULL_37_14]
MKYTVNLIDVNLSNINIVGGKNASIGELIKNLSHLGIKVPGGFATLVNAYQTFLSENHLDKKIDQIIQKTKIKKIDQLSKAGAQIRRLIVNTSFLPEFEKEISTVYAQLGSPTVAVRSSATAEDLPQASFAGQQETYLNVKGIKNILQAIKLVFASLFTNRAIAYRQHHGFDQLEIGMSVGIQPMIRSDHGTSGVIFTLDTESGFDQVILITASYGLGEGIVQGGVIPDEFYVSKPILENGKFSILQRKLGDKHIKMIYSKSKNPSQSTKIIPVLLAERQKFSISDKEVELLGKQALMIEKHYGKPMDIEWAKDGLTGEIYILQARPETVKNNYKQDHQLEQFKLSKKGKILITGQSVGQRIGYGQACVVNHPKSIGAVKPGSVLVTDMTDPDWEPIMKQAAAIVTNRGGRTCHAAIVAREMGIPAVVGCGNATKIIQHHTKITVSCAEGQTGYVYEGNIPFKVNQINIKNLPELPLKLCLNIGNPGKAFTTQFLPNQGVGLARLEFIINHMIGIHPNALLHLTSLPKKIQQAIRLRIAGYANPSEFYIERLREGIATIAAAFHPKEVIFRFSDFKSNEYANLLGGNIFEPEEENPMLGFRGASRYISPQFKACFKMECEAIKRVRQGMGLSNAQVMIPFVRTVHELKKTIKLIEEFGLKRGVNGLKIYMMCELPSNIILANEFLEYVDGYSIGSNDLTQLTLGVDRDSNLVAASFDERDDAIKTMLHSVISICNSKNKYVGICGQGPSDHPDFAQWLLEEKIQCISLNPDSMVDTWLKIAKASPHQHSNLIELNKELSKQRKKFG